jgi:hypothetical protein
MYRPNTKYQIPITLFILLILPFTAMADEFRLVPSIAAKQEYNDNIYLDPKSGNAPTRDWISTFTPKLEMVKNTELIGINLSTRVDQRFYWSNDQLNATDQYHQGSLRYSLSPKLSFTGKGSYIVDSRPDRDVETTGLALSAATRWQQQFGFTGQYAVSEKTLANLTYDYWKYDWNSERFAGMESNTVGFGIIHDAASLMEGTQLTGNLSYSHTRFTGMEMDNYQATVGLVKQLSEKWSVNANAGPRYTVSKFSTQTIQFQFVPPFFVTPVLVVEDKTSYGTGWVGQLALTYKGEKSNADISLYRDISPAYGTIGNLERNAFSLSMRRRFTYELSGTLSGTYFRNQSSAGDLAAQRIDYETVNITPGILYEFTKDVSMDATYTYTKLNNNASKLVADRNLFMVRLYVQHKLFE